MEAFNNGSTLADYDLSDAELVGRGKFSVVHRTRRRRDNKRVALKKIQVFEMMDSKCRNECLNEIKLLQSLGHPHIVQYLDAFIEDNELHVSMELAERGDLGGLIKRAAAASAPLPEGQVWEYFSQVADALRYMHGQRVMHRDIKPANVFIMDSGILKLGDLGAPARAPLPRPAPAPWARGRRWLGAGALAAWRTAAGCVCSLPMPARASGGEKRDSQPEHWLRR